MSKSKGTTLNCFSPPVMLATLTIEGALAVYTLWRYKMTIAARLITSIFVCLGVFQLAEYFVCTGYGIPAEQWSRVGFVAITILPALGIHLMHVLAGKPNRKLVATAYATMAGYVGVFSLYHSALNGHQCTGNYVIFQIGNTLGGLYSLYYFGWLFIGIGLGAYWANKLMESGASHRKQLETVRGLIVGYLVFLVPVALANFVRPETRRGIPSIMCGFAVILAFILAGYILPRAGELKVSEIDLKKESSEHHSRGGS
ncbi:MAG: hypothetical protein ACHQT9_03070 [Candidatus Saccharimonadales bacterium]